MDLKEYLQIGIDQRITLSHDRVLTKKIDDLVEASINTFANGNKIILAGNGGSAADAQHIAAEFVSRFRFDRPGLPALSLATDTSAITAIGNDYGFENLFSRQLAAIGCKGDIFIGISTSGKSPNILRGLDHALELGITPFILTGTHGLNFNTGINVIDVPSSQTCFIQEMHITIGHYICGAVENRIFG